MRSSLLPPFLRACALLFAGILLPVLAFASVDDEFVPEGTLFTRFSSRLETQDRAIDRGKRENALKEYVIPEASNRSQINGSIEREITRHDLRFTYGFSDNWNMSLNIPYLQMEQRSSLSTASANLQATVARLQSDKISGIGQVDLVNMHRPVFSDWNGFIWGYGLSLPGSGQQTPYHDSTTFDLGPPVRRVFIFTHYTRYTSLPRSRFDLRVLLRMGLKRSVETTSGTNQVLTPGNQVRLKLNWSQEIGAVFYGLELDRAVDRANRLDNESLSDKRNSQTLRLQLGFGNLLDLEQGPVDFPYQVQVQVETVERGFNHPFGSAVTLSLLMYF
ncbi:MAG: hypothetical protein O7C61_04640 [SAR324 cluster bacterium]|nr:hypothetical protein [SAR324 cluster bacterium]